MGQEREIRIIPAAKRDPRVTKVGIYARVSTARAEQLRSLAAQVSTLTRHVYKRYDWILKDTYIDVGSAKTGSSRREFTIIEELAADNIPSPRGSERWSKKAVETVLRNTKYTGHVEILKTDPARTSYCMWDAHEPIVSVDDFVEVQRQLAKRTKRQRKQESSSSIFVKQMILRGRATAKGRTKAEEK